MAMVQSQFLIGMQMIAIARATVLRQSRPKSVPYRSQPVLRHCVLARCVRLPMEFNKIIFKSGRKLNLQDMSYPLRRIPTRGFRTYGFAKCLCGWGRVVINLGPHAIGAA